MPRPSYARFQKAIETLPGILECHHVSGRASFMLKAAVEDVAGLERMVGHLSQYGETSTSVVLSTLVQRRVVTEQAMLAQTDRKKS